MGVEHPIRGDLEVQALRLLRALAERARAEGVSVARWAMASCLDRSYLYRILAGRQTPTLQALDALVDGAHIVLRDPVVVELRLRVGTEPIRLPGRLGK